MPIYLPNLTADSIARMRVEFRDAGNNIDEARVFPTLESDPHTVIRSQAMTLLNNAFMFAVCGAYREGELNHGNDS